MWATSYEYGRGAKTEERQRCVVGEGIAPALSFPVSMMCARGGEMCDDFIEFADILSNHPPPDNDVVYEFWRGDATCSCGNEMGLEAPFRYVVLACDECGRPVEFTCDEEIPNS